MYNSTAELIEATTMALQLAITLAGLKVEDYSVLLAHLTGDNDNSRDERPASPSTRSDSSGISSLASTAQHTTASPSPMSSRPETPTEDLHFINEDTLKASKKHVSAIGTGRRKQKSDHDLRKSTKLSQQLEAEKNEKRDILDLLTNIKDTRWSVTHPDVYKGSVKNFMENRSVYFRLSEDGLVEDYPIRECKQCNFLEPSPYLCT